MLLRRLGSSVVLLLLAVWLPAQAGPAAAPMPTATPAFIEVYQIDLEPTGRMFAFGKPTLQGDVYSFVQWPDRTMAHLKRSEIKEMKLWTKDLSKEVVFRIHLLPNGTVISNDQPQLKNGSFVFHTFVGNKIQSLRQSDIKGIEKLTGIEAFKAKQMETGASRIGDLPMQGGGSVKVIGEPPAVAGGPQNAQEPPPPGGSTWIYQGQPGVTDGYAPPPSSIAYPGDVPKAAPVATPRSN
jgi:hypothetical protein